MRIACLTFHFHVNMRTVQITKFLIVEPSPFPVIILLDPNIRLRILFSNTLNLRSCLNVRDHVIACGVTEKRNTMYRLPLTRAGWMEGEYHTSGSRYSVFAVSCLLAKRNAATRKTLSRRIVFIGLTADDSTSASWKIENTKSTCFSASCLSGASSLIDFEIQVHATICRKLSTPPSSLMSCPPPSALRNSWLNASKLNNYPLIVKTINLLQLTLSVIGSEI